MVTFTQKGGFGTTARTTTTTMAPTTTTTAFVTPVVSTKCVVPTLPLNTIQLTKVEYEVGEVIALECKPNHVLVGVNLAICQVNGRFSSIDFECQQSEYSLSKLIFLPVNYPFKYNEYYNEF